MGINYLFMPYLQRTVVQLNCHRYITHRTMDMITYLSSSKSYLWRRHTCVSNQITPLLQHSMMTSSNGNIFRITGHLYGEFTGRRWIPLHKGQWCGALMFSLICVWINGWVNNRAAGDLSPFDVIVMPPLRLSQTGLIGHLCEMVSLITFRY